MTWREALRAMSIDAATRAKNSKPQVNGPSDERSLGERAGAQYAFNVMAEELKYLSDEHTPSSEALKKLRGWLAEGS